MRNRQTFTREFSNYTIVFLLVACSGIPYFVGSYYLMPLSFLLVLVLCLSRGCDIIDLRLFFILTFLLSIAFWREIINDYKPSLYLLLVIILKYSFPFFVLKLLRVRFLYYYRKVLYYISTVSLVIFISITLFPNLEIFLTSSVAPLFVQQAKGGFYTYAPNIIIYTLKETGRNHGPFWEAGGFGVFLIIAIIFHFIEKRSLFDKYGIVYIITALTTFSTAIYIALGVLISVYIMKLKNKNFRLFLMPILFLVLFKVYFSADFLKNKISSQYETVSGNYENRVANRFTSILLDLDKIQEHPIFGNPQNTGARYTIYSHRNNGLSSMAVEYGLIYFILFFVFVYISFKRLLMAYNNYSFILSIALILAILIIYFSQVLTDKPLLNLLALLPFIIGKQQTLKLGIPYGNNLEFNRNSRRLHSFFSVFYGSATKLHKKLTK